MTDETHHALIETPRLAAVIGWPIAHSLSPLIHAIWAAREGANAYYAPVSAGPSFDEFARVADGLKAAGFRGVNVTLPHKEHALRYARTASDEAARAGAANMLTFRADGAYAENSDITGFAASLAEAGGKRGSALVIGAGGAARAVLIALSKKCGVKRIVIANRTRARGEEVAALVGAETVDWGWFREKIPQADIIVNTTTLGMSGHVDLAIDPREFNPETVVCDIVYSPPETALLRAARAKGCKTVDGLSMLMHQAVPGYLAWLGTKTAVDADLRARLEAALKARGE